MPPINIYDPRTILQPQFPFAVSFGSTTDGFEEVIEWWDKYPIGHSMCALNIGKFVWQGCNNFFGERPMDPYLKKGGFLKFWQIVNVNDDFIQAFNQINQKWINAPPIEHIYNWLGIIGQAIGIHWLSMPGLYFCTQRLIAALKFACPHLTLAQQKIIMAMDDNMNPAAADKYFHDNPTVFNLYGTWDSKNGIAV